MVVSLRRYLLAIPILFFITSCGKKKTSATIGDEPADVSDFIAFFQPVKLPWQISDTSLARKEKDTAVISQQVFNKFVPDSILAKTYGKNAKVKIYPLGSVNTGSETYLFAKASSNNKYALLAIAYDKDREFISSTSFVKPASPTLTQTVSMDRKFTITRTLLRKNKDGSFSEGKDVFVLNAEAKNFTLIMTESLDDKMTELINPIDTLPRKHKFAADYSNAKMNLISIRDGRREGRLSFFIHFEKNNGDCTGELKGEAVIKTATLAEYQQEGDPCKLQFIFGKSSVTLREIEGCGSRRGLQCTFDGIYPKKKVAKPSK